LGICALAAWGVGTLTCPCCEGQEPPAELTPGAGTTSTNPPLRLIAPGVFELGKVRFDKNQKTLRFPAVVNQTEAMIEYLIVTTFGKTHESLLRTDVEPYHLQLALLLLGAKGAGANAFPEDETRPLPGDAISIEISWKSGRREKRMPAEDFVYNLQTKSKMSRGQWIYNGSQVVDGTFVAQQDGSIVSVMVDPCALINNPRPGRENDKIWRVRPKGLPPLNSPVEVIIRLLPAAKQAKSD
jgi:hypothetical protein